jgi:hypothetical protein
VNRIPHPEVRGGGSPPGGGNVTIGEADRIVSEQITALTILRDAVRDLYPPVHARRGEEPERVEGYESTSLGEGR